MIPNGMKATLHELRGLVLGWMRPGYLSLELMRDERPETAPCWPPAGMVR